MNVYVRVRVRVQALRLAGYDVVEAILQLRGALRQGLRERAQQALVEAECRELKRQVEALREAKLQDELQQLQHLQQSSGHAGGAGV